MKGKSFTKIMNPRNYIYAKFILTLFFVLNLLTYVLGIIISSKAEITEIYLQNVRKTIYIFMGLTILLGTIYVIILLYLKKTSSYTLNRSDKIYLWMVLGLIILTIILQIFFTSYFVINLKLDQIKIPAIVLLSLTILISVITSILETFSRINETVAWNRQQTLASKTETPEPKKMSKKVEVSKIKETQINNKDNPFAIEEEEIND
ncbi:hypothetical protein [Spiroplasma endosymbiont of Panorpa germanica]|uniref:hypothetical protein n=1 Tax=Spiroplasma endosymbiont of Panorpa germanica TaxID=3066314 RepID=UPI0030D29173